MSALSGITVLEFSRVLAGPWCGMMLADLGAEVIKLESFDGDDTRGMGPPFNKDGLSAYFACCNRNKRSMTIDLRAPAARPLLERPEGEIDIQGGAIYALAVSDIDDRASRLHRRHDVGIQSRGSYHSVDTGKFTLGPAMAIDVADRVRAP